VAAKVKRWLVNTLYVAAAGVFAMTTVAAGLKVAGIPHFEAREASLAVPITPERAAEGRRLALMMCAPCHRNPATGTLSGHPVSDVPPAFGRFAAANITRDPDFGIGRWTDGQLIYLFRTGIRPDGRQAAVMPNFPGLSDEDLASLIAFLRSNDPLTRPTKERSVPPDPSPFGLAVVRLALKPHALPAGRIDAPPSTDRVAFGRYLALRRLDCYGCHSASFTGNDSEHPERSTGFFGGGNELRGADGRLIYSANLTPDPETGIGRWTEADFVRALKRGLRPDNTPLRSPMSLMPELTDEEASAIYAYLRTVPSLRNPRSTAPDAARPVVTSGAVSGEALFGTYCVGCHGHDGRQTFDLTRASDDLRTQEQLQAWIRRPAQFKPDARMPAWEGILTDAEIDAVAAHVRVLAARSDRKE